MKFILGLSVLSLIAAGCGQKSETSSPPPAPPAAQSTTQPAPDATTSENTTDQSQPSAQPPAQPQAQTPAVPSDNVKSAETNPNNILDSDPAINAYEQQIGFQQNALYAEQKALDEAIATRNNTVRLGPDFMNFAAYGISTGFLSWRFLRNTNIKVPKFLSRSQNVAAESEEASDAAAAATTANALGELGPVALRATEAVSAAVLGIFFIGKSMVLGKDVLVRFTDTNDIRAHRAKVNSAEKNLENAKANLAAIYFPQRKPNPEPNL